MNAKAETPIAAFRARRVRAGGGSSRRERMLYGGSCLSLVLAWLVLTGVAGLPPVVDPAFLPSPLDVGRAFMRLVDTGYQGHSLLYHFGISLFRFFAAFLFCLAVGIPLGLLMGVSGAMRAVFDPPIELTRPIPKLALLPLMIVWFGIGELSKILLIVAALFPIISISAMQAVRGVSIKRIQAAQSLGASRAIIFRRVLIPASLPGIFTGVRVALGVGVTMLVGAEMVATSEGIAWMALTASDFVQTDIVLVGVLIMAALGYSLDLACRYLEKRAVHWSGRE